MPDKTIFASTNVLDYSDYGNVAVAPIPVEPPIEEATDTQTRLEKPKTEKQQRQGKKQERKDDYITSGNEVSQVDVLKEEQTINQMIKVPNKTNIVLKGLDQRKQRDVIRKTLRHYQKEDILCFDTIVPIFEDVDLARMLIDNGVNFISTSPEKDNQAILRLYLEAQVTDNPIVAKADEFAESINHEFQRIKAELIHSYGKYTYNKMAKVLTKEGISTPRKGDGWTAESVRRLERRLVDLKLIQKDNAEI